LEKIENRLNETSDLY